MSSNATDKISIGSRLSIDVGLSSHATPEGVMSPEETNAAEWQRWTSEEVEEEWDEVEKERRRMLSWAAASNYEFDDAPFMGIDEDPKEHIPVLLETDEAEVDSSHDNMDGATEQLQITTID
jgi:hypothetical protein